ncbi:MAG: HD domain-containing protein [Lactobacillaceae bacterium]|nr:HD domain-containing protein [Lactobacillaceae bacterium]
MALNNDHSGHGIDHVNRVVSLSNKILETEKSADPFLVIATAYLHDTYDDKLFEDPISEKNKLEKFLTKINVDFNPIFHIIDNMSWSQTVNHSAKPLDINGQIVQDADRLEALGAVSIIRTFLYGESHGRIMYDPNIPPRILNSKNDYRDSKNQTTINHFYEKIFKLKDYLNTDYAKKIGNERDKFTHNFIQELIAEFNLEK